MTNTWDRNYSTLEIFYCKNNCKRIFEIFDSETENISETRHQSLPPPAPADPPEPGGPHEQRRDRPAERLPEDQEAHAHLPGRLCRDLPQPPHQHHLQHLRL